MIFAIVINSPLGDDNTFKRILSKILRHILALPIVSK